MQKDINSLFLVSLFLFFFNDTATTEIYTLSLHDALPIYDWPGQYVVAGGSSPTNPPRSEEHTSELQSHVNLVCRLLLEKKKKTQTGHAVLEHYNMNETNINTTNPY